MQSSVDARYEEALRSIHSLERFGMKPGLSRIGALCRALGDPQKKLRFIHVAGTNGKGSTSTMLANICRQAGYKTGLYISPYVLDFRERIQIDGEMIQKDRLVQVIDRVREAAQSLPQDDDNATEFEWITAAALLYYCEENCDVVVLETGLGGRLDATNIIDCPLVNVIVSISLDHTAVLGDTLSAIAREKCGTLKPGGVCVSYPLQPSEAMAVIRQTAQEKGVALRVPDVQAIQIGPENICGTDAVIDGLPLHIPMLGRHMVYNTSTVVAAARALNVRALAVTDAHIQDGIARSVMPARMQIVRNQPLILMDGGHNEGCALALRDAVKRFLPDRRIVGICGLMADKAYETYLSVVAPLFERMIAVRPDNPRALSAQALRDAAEPFCADCTAAPSFADAARLALETAGDNDVIVVCGSFYMIRDLKTELTKE